MISLLNNNNNDNIFNSKLVNVKLVDYRRNRLVNNHKSNDLNDFYTDSYKIGKSKFKSRRKSRSKSKKKKKSKRKTR